jgi:hypothetical protein
VEGAMGGLENIFLLFILMLSDSSFSSTPSIIAGLSDLRPLGD